ncbi:CLUMA_CG003682, isoform A [Clunio marinus]|uniref:CLUMA_CG003682, isoform A n=1 Tax=Clunio marinus TaxID=568069 RepID=A0A1J1HQY7_9DIPT|nr:CLUMA_CG003682, isoform A [Clunio marinus]
MVFETKEQIIKRTKLARYRFRVLIRKACLNSRWLSVLEDTKLGDNVLKNITIALKRSQQKQSVLTVHDKANLRKPFSERTKEVYAYLETLFDELQCFKSLTPILRRKLINVVEFQFYPKHRTIFREGHKSLSMHFILTGEILISKSTYDKKVGTMIDKACNILTSGDFYGQVGLTYNIPRNATVSTETDCELLCVYKEDFDAILKETMESKDENIKSAIRRFNYFKNFSEETITTCCVISRIEQFNPQQIIYSQNDIMNFAYFVLSGQCMILQLLKIQKNSKGKSELYASKKKPNSLDVVKQMATKHYGAASMIEPELTNIKYQFIDVGTFSCGGSFGIGEEMENRVILARNVVQCLMIPRLWLLQKSQNIGNVWPRLQVFLNSKIPSQQQLFENYLNNQKWKKYKKKTIEEIKREMGLKVSQTKYYNVPVICRVEEDDEVY